MNKEKRKINYIKVILLIVSSVLVAFSTTGQIIISSRGSVSIMQFESFYLYIVTIIASIYLIINNKNANMPIIINLLSYLYTYYLVHETIKRVVEVKTTLGISYYIYMISSIFVLLSLFFNNKEKDLTKENEVNNNVDKEIDKNNFLFTNFLTGLKGIALNTTILLINDNTDKTINMVYKDINNENNNLSIKIPIVNIKDISYISRVKMQNTSKKIEENSTKSALLSAAMFGGSPLLQLAGTTGLNNLFNSLSNNYEKVNYNSYYEITINTVINNIETKLIFTTDNNPEEFINLVNKNKSS
ncbi:MAG: hypothetical protein IKH54_06675 [Bacilli bacterium]|nr:hypothetical protein [Bacilli bacterium]